MCGINHDRVACSKNLNNQPNNFLRITICVFIGNLPLFSHFSVFVTFIIKHRGKMAFTVRIVWETHVLFSQNFRLAKSTSGVDPICRLEIMVLTLWRRMRNTRNADK